MSYVVCRGVVVVVVDDDVVVVVVDSHYCMHMRMHMRCRGAEVGRWGEGEGGGEVRRW